MADRSKIEWTDASWNPIRARSKATGKVGWHCEHASDGCRNCYAEDFNARLGTGLPFKPGHRQSGEVELFLDEKTLLAPLKWRRPRMVFVCSMTDLFADFVPDAWIDRVFAVKKRTPHHTYQVLTKRPDRMQRYASDPETPERVALRAAEMQSPEACLVGVNIAHERARWPLRNVWLMTSAEDQPNADARIPHLMATPAAVRGVSLEPLLGPIDLCRLPLEDGFFDALRAWHWVEESGFKSTVDGPTEVLDWVIVGGESGPNARPMHPDWARSIRDQCTFASVPFFFKQWGAFLETTISREEFCSPAPEHLGEQVVWSDSQVVAVMRRIGKKAAGRVLDSREWNEMPAPHRPGTSEAA